jgi:hypothetical protein
MQCNATQETALVAQGFKADAAVGALHAFAADAHFCPYRERGAAQRAFFACLDLRLFHNATTAGRVFELFSKQRF